MVSNLEINIKKQKQKIMCQNLFMYIYLFTIIK